jgi:hypothetical protein
MTGLFPQRHDDGTTSVAARFAVAGTSSAEELHNLEVWLSQWVHDRTEIEHLDLLADLSRIPYVVSNPDKSFDVCFDGRSDSGRWKDWLVRFVRDFSASVGGHQPKAFVDRIGNVEHPASL